MKKDKAKINQEKNLEHLVCALAHKGFTVGPERLDDKNCPLNGGKPWRAIRTFGLFLTGYGGRTIAYYQIDPQEPKNPKVIVRERFYHKLDDIKYAILDYDQVQWTHTEINVVQDKNWYW
jgi:hypothetical protein